MLHILQAVGVGVICVLFLCFAVAWVFVQWGSYQDRKELLKKPEPKKVVCTCIVEMRIRDGKSAINWIVPDPECNEFTHRKPVYQGEHNG